MAGDSWYLQNYRLALNPVPGLILRRAADGIRLRKGINRGKQSKVFGCLKAQLDGRTAGELLDELRGPVVLRHRQELSL